MNSWENFKQTQKAKGPLESMYIQDMEDRLGLIYMLHQQREDLNISQHELATNCMIPLDVIKQMEEDDVLPDVKFLLRILRYLQIWDLPH